MTSFFEPVVQAKDIESLELLYGREKLEVLLKSDLDFKNDNNNNIRHSWHAFPAKFPPKLAQVFIKNLSEENDIVLDPMMGSCTTLLEAGLLKRNCYGFDIDPLSVITGKAKFQVIDSIKTISLSNQILSNAIKKIDSNSISESEFMERFDSETIKFINYWFPQKTQYELLALIQEIEKVVEENYRSFFKMVFSSIIITKSGGVTYAIDLAHTRPHKSTEKKLKSVFVEFSKRIKKNLESQFQVSHKIVIENADAKNLPLENQVVDLIITSPPYANNAIDYIRAHKFSLVWFGMSINELKQIRTKLIGSDNLKNKNLWELPSFSSEIVCKLKSENEKKGIALHKYLSEMLMVIKEFYRVLKHDRAFVLVIANSIICGINTQTHKCLVELAQMSGFELIGIRERNLNRDRRMMPSGRISNRDSIEARMHQEYVLGFWK
jgi:DNA modification methylase